MSDKSYREMVIERVIAEETINAARRLGHFNHLDSICLNKDMSPEEFTEVYEKILRNVMELCDSRLKNSFPKIKRYTAEIQRKKMISDTIIKCIVAVKKKNISSK